MTLSSLLTFVRRLWVLAGFSFGIAIPLAQRDHDGDWAVGALALACAATLLVIGNRVAQRYVRSSRPPRPSLDAHNPLNRRRPPLPTVLPQAPPPR